MLTNSESETLEYLLLMYNKVKLVIRITIELFCAYSTGISECNCPGCVQESILHIYIQFPV